VRARLTRRGARVTPRYSRWLLPFALLLVSACAQLPQRPELPMEQAGPIQQDSGLDTLVGPIEAEHPGASGFRLVSEGPEAFVIRAKSAALATRSLDVQTYIWHADLTGRFLAHVVLDAADRGVRVRLLLDDMDTRAKNYGFAALDAHPNIEVRLFNPLASRGGTASMALEFMGGFARLNHRMHNKSWIADNRVAVVGGRNLGDEYFGASDEVNFVDLDFAMVGPVVRDVSASFDRYWNSTAVYPIATLSPQAVTAEALAILRERLAPVVREAPHSRYAELLRRDDAVQRMLAGDWPATWVSEYRFVADDPFKAKREPGPDRSEVASALRSAGGDLQKEMSVISPYFVPGKAGTSQLVDTVRSGRQVRILTNSLAANDVAAVHGGYSRYRRRMLEGGVDLWELKPEQRREVESSMFGSSGASLHTKALALDRRMLFVGSFNLDPRSASLNTEQGVLVWSPDLAAQFEAIFARQTSGAKAWRVTLVDGDLRWSDGSSEYDREPMAPLGRRIQAWLARVLPVESQL
jgi:putative cardiolipin synthase